MKKIVIIAVVAVVLIGGSVGLTVFLLGGDEEAAAQEGAEAATEAGGEGNAGGQGDASKAIYHEFHPNFVVNISDQRKTRYLQIDLAAVAYKQSHIDALKNHMPAIRNDLIVLFSSQEAKPLRTQEGKETLRQQALESVRKVMEAKHGEAAIEEVYFNKFVIQ